MISYSQFPYLHWKFDGDSPEKDNVAEKIINTAYYRCDFDAVLGKLGGGVSLGNKDCIVGTYALRNNIDAEFAIEFLFKGATFSFLTFPQPYLVLRLEYERLLFKLTTQSGNDSSYVHQLSVPLKGSGRRSYNYYNDDQWHHFVFKASLKERAMYISVDGECLQGFSDPILSGDQFLFATGDGFRYTDQVDELAFYNIALSARLIRQHWDDIVRGQPYSFRGRAHADFQPSIDSFDGNEIDTFEFAPGYPDYDVQAFDQLESFSLPHFNSAGSVNRNVSWMDINYLHRELQDRGSKGFGRVNRERATDISFEMARHWNYYIDIPLLRVPKRDAEEKYSRTSSVPGALIDLANRNRQYPVSVITVQAQGNPSHAGFDSPKPYTLSQDLPDIYFLRDKSGRPIVYENRKWLSPVMPLDIIRKDGETSRFYLDHLMRHLKAPPFLINENGEIFGHIRKEELLQKDPRVWRHYKNSGLSESRYSGRFQFRMDSTYKETVVGNISPTRTRFSFYGLSAFNPSYWPDYEVRRSLNRWNGDTVLSTPDFYPRFPDNWWGSRGAFNGFGPIAYGRAKEIALGDRLFSPFVAAGWGLEENNIRPAQWLALLKAMVMLGADFFYVGYFNITGTGGRWPNGSGPNDPRGYAYQIAMPTYAQALKTWVPEFFSNGELLNPADPKDRIRQFRFQGKGENELILVRKVGKKYLIYGSIQPNSNIKGNVPGSKITSIELEGKTLSFEIRRQGSTYVLDVENDIPIFYQVDEWHQYEHPYYWKKEIRINAEVFSRSEGKIQVVTQRQSENFNFSNFSSYCSMYRRSALIYNFSIRDTGVKLLKIKARTGNGLGMLGIVLNGEKNDSLVISQDKEWRWYEVEVSVKQPNCELRITADQNIVEIDQLTLE